MPSHPIADSNVPEDACRFCSQVSQRQQEDPVGSADAVDEWLFVEVPRPWGKNPWAMHPAYGELLHRVEALDRHPRRYLRTRLQAIAPPRNSPVPTQIRVLYYHRPQFDFSVYHKLEYFIPLEQCADLVHHLLFHPADLAGFRNYAQHTGTTRDLFICTHAHYDLACGHFGAPLYQTLRRQYASEHVRVWQVNHFGGHQFAPTLLDFPSGHWWGHLTPKHLEGLLHRRGSIDELSRCFRGWSGLPKFAQWVDRALWMQIGWEWLEATKSARILEWYDQPRWRSWLRPLLQWVPHHKAQQLLQVWQRQAQGAVVELRVTTSTHRRVYRATVQQTHVVQTQLNSVAKGEAALLVSVPQYAVQDLKLIASRSRKLADETLTDSL
jgi:hypothetical protein